MYIYILNLYLYLIPLRRGLSYAALNSRGAAATRAGLSRFLDRANRITNFEMRHILFQFHVPGGALMWCPQLGGLLS